MSRKNLLVLGLVLSLGVNLFVLGGIVTRINNSRDYAQARPFPPNVGWIIRDLDESRQEELSEVLAPLGEQASPLRRAMMNAQRQVNRLMSASEFDEAALSAAFDELREAAQAYTALSHEQTLLVMSLLTAEERLAATEFVQRRGPRDGRDSYRGPGSRSQFSPDGRRGPGGNRPSPGFPPPDDAPPPGAPNR